MMMLWEVSTLFTYHNMWFAIATARLNSVMLAAAVELMEIKAWIQNTKEISQNIIMINDIWAFKVFIHKFLYVIPRIIIGLRDLLLKTH